MPESKTKGNNMLILIYFNAFEIFVHECSFDCCRYMAKILLIWRKILFNQSTVLIQVMQSAN